jgi:hypothetical protein
VLADPMMNRNASYVALTRHREGLRVYSDRETFENREDLDRALSRAPAKDLARDYAAAAIERHAARFEPLKEQSRGLQGVRPAGALAGAHAASLGFGSGGRRRSEVAAARVEDLAAVDGGYLFRLRRSKTDQAGEGLELPVLGRAARALAAWLAAADLTEGPLFRPLSWHGRLGAGPLRPQRRRDRQGPRRPGRLRPAGVRRPQPALRLHHHRRPPGRELWRRHGSLRPPRRRGGQSGGEARAD